MAANVPPSSLPQAQSTSHFSFENLPHQTDTSFPPAQQFDMGGEDTPLIVSQSSTPAIGFAPAPSTSLLPELGFVPDPAIATSVGHLMETAFLKYQADLKAEADKKKAAAAMVAASLSGGSTAAASGLADTSIYVSDEEEDPVEMPYYKLPDIPPEIMDSGDREVLKFFKKTDLKLPNKPKKFETLEMLIEQFHNVVPNDSKVKILSKEWGVKGKNFNTMWASFAKKFNTVNGIKY